MAKKPLYGKVQVYEKKFKGTSIGNRPKKVSTMNKHKRKGRTRKQLSYQVQGKWIKKVLKNGLLQHLWLIKGLTTMRNYVG